MKHSTSIQTCAVWMNAGGSRLFRQWLCRPLHTIKDINNRLDAVNEISKQVALVGSLRRLLESISGAARLVQHTAKTANQQPNLCVQVAVDC